MYIWGYVRFWLNPEGACVKYPALVGELNKVELF